jgi:hypothetical protein
VNRKEKKERKLRSIQIYEKKIGGEYVKWVKNQPTYTLFEWVEYKS